MNLLYDTFPETVQVDDVSYAVYTDFRNWLRFFDMMADEAYTAKEKFLASMRWFRKEPPPNLIGAYEALLQFASRTDVPGEEQESENSHLPQKPCFSWSFDSAYVLGAFQQCYQINLRTIPFLHWYHFLALFEALPDDTPLKKRIGYRSINTASIKDKTQRMELEKLQRRIAIPCDPLSAEQVGAFF
ncbi:MAG: bacteriophage Gp15 family protein [Ruminococcus sp.]|nr:bacteriophage Gp15 family protein [Ruminococcus sp.]MDD6110261.1 bacteriophage Gp15 family protein [Ruminococcus sp.]MDD6429965.1 bacteriophage Gp15 family protein [Ruminococcus sp.]MDD6586653.1 bacteriophage Gp15 family protein [Ruminococcus sp.]